MISDNLEVVTCSRCGKPYPKKRKDCGYDYCVDCSAERPYSYIFESHEAGSDSMYVETIIVTAEEADRNQNLKEIFAATLDRELKAYESTSENSGDIDEDYDPWMSDNEDVCDENDLDDDD